MHPRCWRRHERAHGQTEVSCRFSSHLRYRVTDTRRSAAMMSVADEPYGEHSPIFVKEMTNIFKDAFKTFPPKTKNATSQRMDYIKQHISSNKGPYNMIPKEIFSRMDSIVKQWAVKTSARIDRMHADLHNVLFKSFEGKQMPEARRKQVGPGIKREIERTIAVLQADRDGYSADFF